MLEITVKGDRELAVYLDSLNPKIVAALKRGVTESWVLLERAIKTNLRNVILHRRSGQLSQSVTHELSEDGLAVRVGPNKVYAAIHEFGGIIRAKNAPYLRFKTEDGFWHSVKQVTIPPRPYVGPAFRTNIERIKTIFEKKAAEAVK